MSFFETLPNVLVWNPLHFWWLILGAVALDYFFPDPAGFPHPVHGIGKLLNLLEKPARRMKSLLVAGLLAVAVVILLVGVIVGGLIWLPYGIGIFATAYLVWAGLALGGLLREGKKTLAHIAADNLDEARSVVSGLVTRDVTEMDAESLCRTLAETISENLNDAFIAPFFWLQCTGPIGLWIYKAVSTMDSMWGYKTEKWKDLGWAGAKLDDVLAFIPARLTAFFYFLSAPFAKLPPRWPGWGHVAIQANLMESPNAGWPMAAAAWLHGAGMGGPAVYHGEVVQKPILGPISGHWTVEATQRLIRHTAIAGIFAALTMWGIAAVTAYWVFHKW